MLRISRVQALFLLGLCLGLVGSAAARRANNDDQDGFPDYNRLEYAKPLPPPDQQVPEAKPGSFHMVVGKKEEQVTIPLDAVPMPLARPSASSDDSEPPLTDIFQDSKPPQTVQASTAATTIATSPVHNIDQ